MVEIAAVLATLLIVGLIILQLLLIAGVPIGYLAWGGQHRVLPRSLRIASMTSVLLFISFIIIMLNQAGIIGIFSRSGWTKIAMILLTAYFFIGIAMNAISRSKPERFVMTPVAAILALLFLYVLLNVK